MRFVEASGLMIGHRLGKNRFGHRANYKGGCKILRTPLRYSLSYSRILKRNQSGGGPALASGYVTKGSKMSGYQAYGKVQNVTENPRSLEYRLLGQVTAALTKARDGKRGTSDFVDAMLWNKKVWDAFIVDLSSEGNKLPKELRAQIIGIGLWVGRETIQVLDGTGDIDSLINVNKTIMEGLAPQSSTAASAAPASAAAPAGRPVAGIGSVSA
jgi:flagellar biosynthesis activator protein FlaF